MRTLMFLVAVSLLGLASACHHPALRPEPRPTTATASDASLASAVALALYDADIPGRERIEVRAAAGTVLLLGPVEDLASRERALAVARGVEGVLAVEDRLEVPSR